MSGEVIFETIQKISKMKKEQEHCKRCTDELKERIFSGKITMEEIPILKMELWFFHLFITYKQECILEMIRRLDQI